MNTKERKYEARFQCNIDYHGTYKKAFGHRRIASLDQTQKGHIYIKLEGLEKVSTLISTQGTIQIFYFTLSELNACREFLEEILVPRFGEKLCLTPQGTYALVDKIRRLIQERKITHDMHLDSERLAELVGWEKEDIRDALPTILEEIFPFGIELKVSGIIAGCTRAESHVEEWLVSVEQALKREGFYSPCSFEWEQNQFFELVNHLYTGGNHEGVMSVKAFLDGRVIAEANPKCLTQSASRVLDTILGKYDIPYEIEIWTERAKSSPIPVVILLALTLGTLALCGLSNSSSH